MQDNVDDQTGSSTYDADLGYRTLKVFNKNKILIICLLDSRMDD